MINSMKCWTKRGMGYKWLRLNEVESKKDFTLQVFDKNSGVSMLIELT